jgi:hypothetical protein
MRDPENDSLIISGDWYSNIATLWDNFDSTNEGEKIDQTMANASLIAAAPELLDALERVVYLHYNGSVRQVEDAMIHAQKAIEKAKGE